MQAEDQISTEELLPAPLQDRKQHCIQDHHDQNQRPGLHVNQVIKRSGELGKANALRGDSGLDQPGGQAAIGHHVQLNTKRCAQPAPSKIRLDNKINQVRDKEELKGMQVRLRQPRRYSAVRNPGLVKRSLKLRKIWNQNGKTLPARA